MNEINSRSAEGGCSHQNWIYATLITGLVSQKGNVALSGGPPRPEVYLGYFWQRVHVVDPPAESKAPAREEKRPNHVLRWKKLDLGRE